MIVDVQTQGNDASLLMYAYLAFPTGGYRVSDSVHIEDHHIVMDVLSSPPPPNVPVTQVYCNLLSETWLRDLEPGEYSVTGNWHRDGEIFRTGQTSFAIGADTAALPEPGSLVLLLTAAAGLPLLLRRRTA